MGQAASDPDVDDRLVVVNGAKGGQGSETWDEAADENYARIAEEVLPAFGVTEAQVQVVWLKAVLEDQPSRPSLPASDADAYEEEEVLGDVIRALRVRYPSLRQVFVSSRSYAGYAEGETNGPEPYAYETGFAVKWLVEAQVVQRETGRVDREAGDLSEAVAPWVGWGPYLWAPGDAPRADGLVWRREYFEEDGIHPSASGEAVVGSALLSFFKGSPFAACWFRDDAVCL
jgi:hypothetical protein